MFIIFDPVYDNCNRLSPPEYGLKPDVVGVSEFERINRMKTRV